MNVWGVKQSECTAIVPGYVACIIIADSDAVEGRGRGRSGRNKAGKKMEEGISSSVLPIPVSSTIKASQSWKRFVSRELRPPFVISFGSREPMKKTRVAASSACLFGYLLVLLTTVVDIAQAGDYGKLFERCTNEKNTFDCLKRRALEVLDTAIRDDSVYVINDFVSIAKDSAAVASNQQRSHGGSFNDTGVKTLDEQLDKKFYEYLSSRSIKLTIPGDAVEGRRKKGKGYGGALMVGAIAVAGVMAQLAYGKIAFLAGTALLTAKIALVLSAIIGLKKLVSSSGGGGGHEVIYATASEHHGGGYGGWQRSVDTIPPT